MSAESGQMLSHYRLVEKIGEGGMGVVWKAVDTSLNREVAIKVLPEAFATDTERLARFEREAKLLASLNHPNVAAIYGIHEAESIRFLAMELVEGQDLAERLSRGALPVEEAIRIALEIARGFEAAHDKGVIHRDLKPANVKLSPGGAVKVLDFGLAKAFALDTSGESAPSLSPTITSLGTVAGMILGTAAYMSPEQAKGKTVDRRADIWSFGAVLFEMLSGRQMFQGETVSETMAAVLMKDPEWNVLPAGTPEPVKRLLQRCLQREPTSRLRDIGDARIVLDEALRSPISAGGATAEQAPATRRALLPWILAAVFFVALLVVLLSRPAERASNGVMRLKLPIPESVLSAGSPLPRLAISPDGNKVVFLGFDDAKDNSQLYLRAIDQTEVIAIHGTEGAHSPTFSPDGQWIAFGQDGMLKKVRATGGPSMTLCEAPLLRGLSWADDGTIVFAPRRASGLMRVLDAGGTPEPLTTLDFDPSSTILPSHRWPEVLPGSRAVLFTATENDSDYSEARIVAVTLDGGQVKTIVERGSFPRYVPAGFLVFVRGATLFAGRFDPQALELLSPAVPVLEGIANQPLYGNTQLAFSDDGVLIYLDDSASGVERLLSWIDREGNETPASATRARFRDLSLSPDGKRVAISIFETNGIDVWILELERDILSRLTLDSALDQNPVWSPDGQWIAFDSLRETASRNIYRVRSNGTGEVERLTTSARHNFPQSWSPDGKTIAFVETETETGSDVMLLRLGDPPEVEAFLQTPFNQTWPTFSPDGRWLAYVSDESGQDAVYVVPVGRPGARTKISTQDGFAPRWTPDGKELLYVTREEKLMSVAIPVVDGELRPELPSEVIAFPRAWGGFYSVSLDGKRVLINRNAVDEGASLQEPTVVVGWFDELEARVPKGR